jgi:hypothetical protein
MGATLLVPVGNTSNKLASILNNKLASILVTKKATKLVINWRLSLVLGGVSTQDKRGPFSLGRKHLPRLK